MNELLFYAALLSSLVGAYVLAERLVERWQGTDHTLGLIVVGFALLFAASVLTHYVPWYLSLAPLYLVGVFYMALNVI